MRDKLTATAAALAFIAGALLGWAGWIVCLVLASMIVAGLVILAAEAARPFVRAIREVWTSDDYWGFAGRSRIE